jgi:hypothetical protein
VPADLAAVPVLSVVPLLLPPPPPPQPTKMVKRQIVAKAAKDRMLIHFLPPCLLQTCEWIQNLKIKKIDQPAPLSHLSPPLCFPGFNAVIQS